MINRLKMLYSKVKENETPLPRCWSSYDRCLSIGLSPDQLRVNYEMGNDHRTTAASIRTPYPIPSTCGLYYFEVTIISMPTNGYVGIGLTSHQFRMNRLPGWDKQSYGYHGDDGNAFNSSDSGRRYGPTFTTGDIIGCGVNFVDGTCFYTKNGLDLGIAFTNLPTTLYPTVGLQAPGVEVFANFGQEPFIFHRIEDMMKELHIETKAEIDDFPLPEDSTTLLNKMVSSYLMHNGFSQTGEAFARAAQLDYREESSIGNREKISKLIMSGEIGEAIDATLESFPGVLEKNTKLQFMLKCRQFIEMVNVSDLEYYPIDDELNSSNITATADIASNDTSSTIRLSESYKNVLTTVAAAAQEVENAGVRNTENTHPEYPMNTSDSEVAEDDNNESTETADQSEDIEMQNTGEDASGDSNSSSSVKEEAETEKPLNRTYSNGIEGLLELGKDLFEMGEKLEKEKTMSTNDRQMLDEAFSLMTYVNPKSSPLSGLLCSSKRETVRVALNSAILQTMNYPPRPALEVGVAHAAELLMLMARASLGASAFVDIEDVFPQN